MYFNFDTDPFSPFFVIDGEEHGYQKLSPEERERRLNWHLPEPRKKATQQVTEPDEFAQDDPGFCFDPVYEEA